ncbi:hypothetical protein [Propionivibrio sp.]|uniref:hypothetical protein n=1 Tax=Propionivibrio sp. TaxID=2212460 RepID=UPI003BEF99F3
MKINVDSYGVTPYSDRVMKNITNQNEINEAFAKFQPDGDGAYATGACLPGQYQQENMQQWAERGTIDGAPAKIYFLFENSEAEVEDGVDMPFDAAHIDSIDLAEADEDGDYETL